MISAHYGLSDVFDNLIISLCKFTALSSEVSKEQELCTWSSKEDLFFSYRSTLSCGAGFPQHVLSLPPWTKVELRPFLSDTP